MVKFEWKTTESVLRALRTLAKEYPKHLDQAAYQEANVVMTEAKKRTPVAIPAWYREEYGIKYPGIPGTLRSSGHVKLPERKGGTVTITLAFGGAAKSYAIYVHENLRARHPVGRAKFLESAVMEALPTFGARVARRAHLSRMTVI